MTVIVGDLGASNARLAFIRKGRFSDIYQFACDDFKDPMALLCSFKCNYAPDAKYVLLGVPGPVIKGMVKWTNRSWCLKTQQIEKELQLKQAVLMNDLQVQGWGVKGLSKKDLSFLQRRDFEQGPRALINVGTGLGSCYITGDDVYATEYGQTLLPDQKRLEDVVSALVLKKHLSLKDSSTRSKKVAEFYMDLADAAKNLALTLKTSGGLYISGSILDQKAFAQLKFKEHFTSHPKMQTLLKTMPICFIKKKDFAFVGLKTLVKKLGWS